MQLENGYFHESDGRRFLPFGIFGNYFCAEYTGDEITVPSQHGYNLMEFGHCTRSVWEHLFSFLRADGINTIRLFPRGDSGGSAWEGLDVGGRVNTHLLELILAYAKTARRYGIHTVLGLFTQPECSVYCRHDTRVYWGIRLFDDRMRAEATPAQKRFLENDNDLVPYEDFFSDPDVRSCCHSYLDEILPVLAENEDIIALELYNEMGWASPNAVPMNTFRWEFTDRFLDWSRDMTAHIRRLAPKQAVLISNPGVGLLGHDPVQWMNAIRPDMYSFHTYPGINGAKEGMDYAAMSCMCLKYTMAAGAAMFGEWEALHRPQETDTRRMTLCSRDFAWFSVLSGAPGCVSWRARGYGQYQAITQLFSMLETAELTPAEPERIINIAEAYAYFVSLVDGGEAACRISKGKWCPDCAATDGKHRFCLKAESAVHTRLAEIERWSLETGAPYRFSLTEGKPLMQWKQSDFSDAGPVCVPAGYHQKAFYAKDGKTGIVYLRNYKPYSYRNPLPDGQSVEDFCIREQEEQTVTLLLRDKSYGYTVFDLDSGEKHLYTAGVYPIGKTAHDYVILLRK